MGEWHGIGDATLRMDAARLLCFRRLFFWVPCISLFAMTWFIGCLRKYTQFSGRARRREYWSFMFFYILGLLTIIGISTMIGYWVQGQFGPGADAEKAVKDAFDNKLLVFCMLPTMIYAAVMLLPSIAVSVRRLHDVDMSGWTYLVQWIPFIGSPILFFLHVTNSDKGSNDYGLNPKGEDDFMMGHLARYSSRQEKKPLDNASRQTESINAESESETVRPLSEL